ALDTYFLHQGVLPKLLGVGDDGVRYAHSLAEVVEAVREGKCRLAVLLRPTPAQQIVAVADARENMPAKSTFFHPKMPSGLVIHPRDGWARCSRDAPSRGGAWCSPRGTRRRSSDPAPSTASTSCWGSCGSPGAGPRPSWPAAGSRSPSCARRWSAPSSRS